MTIYFVHFGNATAEWMHKKPRRTSERNENPITDKYKANEIATRKQWKLVASTVVCVVAFFARAGTVGAEKETRFSTQHIPKRA